MQMPQRPTCVYACIHHSHRSMYRTTGYVCMQNQHTHRHIHIHTHIHTFAHTCTHPTMHTYTHTHAYTYTRMRARAHSHTHPTCIQAENLHTTLVLGIGTPMQQPPTGITSSRSVLADRCIFACLITQKVFLHHGGNSFLVPIFLVESTHLDIIGTKFRL